ncbi:MAG: hypothetical protein ACPLPT_10665 [Moorellales bacterium]
MISAVDKEVIRRLYYVEGKSIRWIHRELGYALSRLLCRQACS